jgi:hypothetical protein
VSPGRLAGRASRGRCTGCCASRTSRAPPRRALPTQMQVHDSGIPQTFTESGRQSATKEDQVVYSPDFRAAVFAAAAYPRCCAGGPRRRRRLQPAAASMKGIQGRATGATVAVDNPINVPRSVGRVGDEVVGGHVDAAASRRRSGRTRGAGGASRAPCVPFVVPGSTVETVRGAGKPQDPHRERPPAHIEGGRSCSFGLRVCRRVPPRA